MKASTCRAHTEPASKALLFDSGKFFGDLCEISDLSVAIKTSNYSSISIKRYVTKMK